MDGFLEREGFHHAAANLARALIEQRDDGVCLSLLAATQCTSLPSDLKIAKGSLRWLDRVLRTRTGAGSGSEAEMEPDVGISGALKFLATGFNPAADEATTAAAAAAAAATGAGAGAGAGAGGPGSAADGCIKFHDGPQWATALAYSYDGDVAVVDDEEQSPIECMVASIPLRSKDLLTLQPGAWLNDEIINAWAELLRIRDAGCTVQGHRRSLFMNSFFLPHLLQGGAYTYKNVEQWTTETKLVKNCGSAARTIFDLDKVVIPVNAGSMHWSLAVIYIQDKKIQHYDSLGHSGDITLQVLQKYVVDELASKLGGPEHQEPPQERPDPSTYSLVPTEEDSPRQGNGSDCGPFTCLTAECVAAGRGLDAVEGEVPKFRENHAEQCFRKGGLGAGSKEGDWYAG